MTQSGPQVLHGSFNADTSQSMVPRGSIGNITNVQLSRNSHSGGDSTTSSSGLSSHTTQLDASSTETNFPDSENKIRLTLLLVSGRRCTFLFEPGDTVTKVKNTVFNEWPRDWVEETPAAVSCLKIVFRGRFLDDDTTLESNRIPRGQSTIVHLTIKNVQDENRDTQATDNAPKCQCTIL